MTETHVPPHNWSFVQEIHRLPVDYEHKGLENYIYIIDIALILVLLRYFFKTIKLEIALLPIFV